MRSVSAALALLACAAFCGAQDPVMQVATYPFTTATQEPEDLEEAALLSSFCNESLSKNPYIALLPRSIDEILDKERTEQMNPEYIRGKIAKQGVAMGATHTMAGFLSSCNLVESEKKLPNGSTSSSWNATVSFQLMLIDQATGMAIGGAKTFTASAGSGFAFGQSERSACLERTNRKAKKLIRNWMSTVLPNDFKILRTQDSTKKGVPTMLLLKGGLNLGITKGEELQVVELEVLDGVNVENVVATLKVDEVQRETSICKVKKGGEELKAKLEAKAKYLIWFKPDDD